MSKKISIIIPVYNGQEYLDRCIDSIVSQKGFNRSDLDIIFLDDESTDSSPSVIKAYERKYPNEIRLICQKNMGVAKTRNRGISLAEGKYVVFIDQDDWIDADYCRKLYDEIERTSADVVYAGYRRPDVDGKIRQTVQPVNSEYGKYITLAAWAKIHRTSFLLQEAITFYSNPIGEDGIFTVKEITRTRKWKHLNYCGYNWFYNNKSVSNTIQKELTGKNSAALDHLIGEFINVGNDSAHFQYFLLRNVTYGLLFSGRKSSTSNFTHTADLMFSRVETRFPRVYRSRLVLFGPTDEDFRVHLAIVGLILLRKSGLMLYFARIYCKN